MLSGCHGSNELNSSGAGAMGGVGGGEGVVDGGGRPRSNQDGARARRRKVEGSAERPTGLVPRFAGYPSSTID